VANKDCDDVKYGGSCTIKCKSPKQGEAKFLCANENGDEKTKLTGKAFKCTDPYFTYGNSQLPTETLNSAQYKILNDALAKSGYGNKQWKGCWGWQKGKVSTSNASAFNSACRGKGMSVTIIWMDNGQIFGGFNPDHWHTSSVGYRNVKSFLFRLNRGKDNNQKLGRFDIYRYPQYATYNNTSYGPCFGGGHDLCLNGGNNWTNSYANAGYVYRIYRQNGQDCGYPCYGTNKGGFSETSASRFGNAMRRWVTYIQK